MAGTSAGAKKAVARNLEKDPDFYKRIGKRGGESSSTGGFAAKTVGSDGLTGPQRARQVGKLGGHVSRRPKKQAEDNKDWWKK